MGTDIAAGNAMDAADTAMNVVADAVSAGATDMKQAMRQRHTVRKFTSALPGALKLFFAKGVRNYFVLAGSDRPGLDEDLGYASADLMLFAQTLGLNTWWIGGTFSRKNVERAVPGKKVIGIVAVGFGATPGVAHKSKTAAGVSSYEGPIPQWFADGVQAALLAPTALNKQCFRIAGAGNKVSVTEDGGAFSGADIGIVKYHFELGAGNEFDWA